MSGRSGYGRSKIVGKLINLPANMMMAGLAPKVGKPGWAIRLYWKRVDDCCVNRCLPITIVKRIVWYPYNNAVDTQGNPRPNASNYVAIQFNKPLTVFPDPPITTPTIQGDFSPNAPTGGAPANLNFQPAKRISYQLAGLASTWKITFTSAQAAGPGNDPATIPGTYFQEVNTLNDPIPPAVYLMEDLQEYNTNGILEVKHPGQWVVFWVSRQVSGAGALGQNRMLYKRYPNGALAAWDDANGFGGILNTPTIQLKHKLQYTPPAVPQTDDAELRTIDCETNSVVSLAPFNDSYLDSVFIK